MIASPMRMRISLKSLLIVSIVILSALSAQAEVVGMLSESATQKVEYVTTNGNLEIRLTGYETTTSLIVTRFFPRQENNVSSYLSALLGNQIPLNAVSDILPQDPRALSSIKLAIFNAEHSMQYQSHFTGEAATVPHLNIARTYVTGSDGQAVQVFVVELQHPTLLSDDEAKAFSKGKLNIQIATQAKLPNNSESTVKAIEVSAKVLNRSIHLGSSFENTFEAMSCRKILL